MPAKYPQPGSGGASFYHHTQGVPSALWTIIHGLGYQPNVTVADSTERQVEGDVSYPNVNTVVIAFSAAFAGEAFLS